MTNSLCNLQTLHSKSQQCCANDDINASDIQIIRNKETKQNKIKQTKQTRNKQNETDKQNKKQTNTTNEEETFSDMRVSLLCSPYTHIKKKTSKKQNKTHTK